MWFAYYVLLPYVQASYWSLTFPLIIFVWSATTDSIMAQAYGLLYCQFFGEPVLEVGTDGEFQRNIRLGDRDYRQKIYNIFGKMKLTHVKAISPWTITLKMYFNATGEEVVMDIYLGRYLKADGVWITNDW